MRPTVLKILLISTLAVAVVGFALHLTPTSIIKEDYFTIKAGAVVTKPVQIQPNFLTNEFELDLSIVLGINETTSSIGIIVNETEYLRFKDGISPSSLVPLVILDKTTWASNETWFQTSRTLTTTGPLYILIENSNPIDFYAYMSLTVRSSLYYSGLIVGACGALGGMIILALIFTGWKRNLIIGVGVNLIPFFIGIALQTEFIISDFQVRYVPWVEQFLSGASLYSPVLSAYPNYIDPGFTAYPYPPLFVLTLAGFNFLPGPPWKLALPLEVATHATGYLIFKIVKKLTNNDRRATVAMLVYFLNPFTLIFGSFQWWNPSLFVFFTVLAFYFAMEKKSTWAMISLGVATMYKQLAIVFLPILLITLAKDFPEAKITSIVKKMLKPAAIFCATILVISSPFLVEDASGYVYEVFLNQIGSGVPFETLINDLMTLPLSNGLLTFNAFFVWVGAPPPVTLSIAYLLQLYILLGACMILLTIHLIRNPSRNAYPEQFVNKTVHVSECLFIALVLVFCLQLFFPRGSYKYYLMLLTPFISIFYDMGNLRFISQGESKPGEKGRAFLTPILLSGVILGINRYLSFLILLGWMSFYILQKRKQEQGVPLTFTTKSKKMVISVVASLITIIVLIGVFYPTQVLQAFFIEHLWMVWA